MLSEETLHRFQSELIELRGKLSASLAGSAADQKVVELERARFERLPCLDARAVTGTFKPSKAQVQLALKRIDAAMLRLRAGRFGLCCRCGQEVERERLLEDPGTPFCEACFDEVAAQRQDARH